MGTLLEPWLDTVVALLCCAWSLLLSGPCPQPGQAQTQRCFPGETTPVWWGLEGDTSTEEEEEEGGVVSGAVR